MKLFAQLGLTSLLVAGLSPLPYAPLGPSAVWAEEPYSPVKCKAQGSYDSANSVNVYGTRKAVGASNSLAPSAPPPPSLQARPVSKESRVETKQPPTMMAPPPALSVSVPPRLEPMAVVQDLEKYDGRPVSSVFRTSEAPVSTFGADVDTAAYANTRRMLKDGKTPPSEAVRTEEMINYFRYDYTPPTSKSQPFSVTTDVAQTPWNAQSRLLRIGIKAYDTPRNQRPASNLVFLIDVSGSMSSDDKLPLVISALKQLGENLRPDDKVSIVVYAGAAGIVLEPTYEKKYIDQALSCLSAGGSTAGGQGMQLAYDTARTNYIDGGINRVIMATDGDFNVGISTTDAMESLVKTNAKSGVTLTVLGFGTGNINDEGMEHMADFGNGNYAYIDSMIEARKVLDQELDATLFTVAKDVKFQIEFNPAYVAQYRLIGYENRTLAEQDFDNDKVDSGDIGSGHQVTALYEIIPVDAKGWLPDRHFTANQSSPSDHSNQMAWLKLRYKPADGDTSTLIEQPIMAATLKTTAQPNGDFAFATAVAAFGQILRHDPYMNDFTMKDVRTLAGTQNDYLRQEFLVLTSLAESQAPKP